MDSINLKMSGVFIKKFDYFVLRFAAIAPDYGKLKYSITILMVWDTVNEVPKQFHIKSNLVYDHNTRYSKISGVFPVKFRIELITRKISGVSPSI